MRLRCGTCREGIEVVDDDAVAVYGNSGDGVILVLETDDIGTVIHACGVRTDHPLPLGKTRAERRQAAREKRPKSVRRVNRDVSRGRYTPPATRP